MFGKNKKKINKRLKQVKLAIGQRMFEAKQQFTFVTFNPPQLVYSGEYNEHYRIKIKMKLTLDKDFLRCYGGSDGYNLDFNVDLLKANMTQVNLMLMQVFTPLMSYLAKIDFDHKFYNKPRIGTV